MTFDGNDTYFAYESDAVTTTDAYAVACTIRCPGFRTKEFYIGAATNNIKYKVEGSLDGGTTYPKEVIAEATVVAAAGAYTQLTNGFTNLRVQVKSAVASTPGVATIQACGVHA